MFYVFRELMGSQRLDVRYNRFKLPNRPSCLLTVPINAVRHSSVHYLFILVQFSVYEVVSSSPVLCQCIKGVLFLSLFSAVSFIRGPYDARFHTYLINYLDVRMYLPFGIYFLTISKDHHIL